MNQQTVAVIGAGFSGVLLALQLLRRCPATTSVTLIERNGGFGRGQAYSTENPNHLLNVPAGRMSAFRDRPDDFIDWLRQRAAADPALSGVSPGSFVPRALFGQYMRHLLEVERSIPERGGRLTLLRGEVVALRKQPDSLSLDLADGRVLRAGLAALAVGNFPPGRPPGSDPDIADRPWYRPDPWAPEAFTGLDPEAPVLLIGTALSMIDGVVSLLDLGHRGPIHAVSRRGLVPRPHPAQADPLPASPIPPLPTDMSELLRLVRQEARRRLADGGSWHAVVDALRPSTQDLWQAMTLEEKSRFLRHLRPWWDVHRHRMANPVARRVEEARASGQLRIHAGHLRTIADAPGGAAVTFCRRQDGVEETLTAARLVNCAGPAGDYDHLDDPLVRDLLASGHARLDALRLGLDVTSACALRDANGAVSRRVFAIGPVTRAAFWEMTAVPDIRRQCEVLADHLAAVSAVAPPLMASAAS
ncbi:FAD/NAD(P)-binding protein [Roseococcus pinisoli]|uniref:FAD/NAD(P)-binding protein n=1 Tax=Roseococcus pinisoli TaxID=2835040 RepID=A0ABS5QEL1_9PROT|nr:FAD/NAD(P)-binding protein [Roseococcus pinisoli]MBS7811008.1 FAD/NAD(P)-binding protein [Roseococcus pinisoli]